MATSWRLALTVGEEVLTATLRFNEDPGYEPPQGQLIVDSCIPEGALQCGQPPQGRQLWKLSEDPDDPKDSLWIWGLFKEPLYPFILGSVVLAEEWAGLAAGTTIYLQGEHKKNPELGTLLGEGEASVRVSERVGVGPGAVDVDAPEPVGTFNFLGQA